MAYEEKDLAVHFRTLADEELLRQCSPAVLTDEALILARSEVLSRGLPLPMVPESIEPETTEGRYLGDFKIVARLLDPSEAHFLKHHLESCSIPAVVADANLVQVNPFLVGAVGGVSVRVPQAFMQEAVEIVAKFQGGEFALDEQAIKSNAEFAEFQPNTDVRGLKTFRIYSRANNRAPIVVKVGFSWGAFIFGPLWLLVNQMWLNFLIVATFVVGANLYFHNNQPTTREEQILFLSMYVLSLFTWFLIGKFGNFLLSVDLESKGYKLVATVKAKNATYARGMFEDDASRKSTE